MLPHLTADDLKDIGVSAVGDRRRLLAAIAALEGDASGGCSLPQFKDNMNFGYGPCSGRSGRIVEDLHKYSAKETRTWIPA